MPIVPSNPTYTYALCVQCGKPMYLSTSINSCSKCRWYPLCDTCAEGHPECCVAAGNPPPYSNTERVAFFFEMNYTIGLSEETGELEWEESEFIPPCLPENNPEPPPPPPQPPEPPPPPRPNCDIMRGTWDQYIRS